MPLLPVIGQKLNLVAGTPASSDTFQTGFRWQGNQVLSGLSLTPTNYSQGLPIDANGQLCLVDATVALPAGAQVQDGLALTASGLCTSTGSQVSWCNGLPMAANGAVCI